MSRSKYALFLTPPYALSALVVYLGLTADLADLGGLRYVRVAIFVAFLPIVLKYLIQLLSTPFYSVRERSRGRSDYVAFSPLVSVLIPAWNEEVGVEKTVRSVQASSYPNLEIIVINDGSTDGTHDVVSSLLDEQDQPGSNGPVLIYRRLPNGGKAKALNHGLGIARGEIVITVDADSMVEPETVARLVRRFSDRRFARRKVGAVAGNVVVGKCQSHVGVIQQLEYLYGFFFKRADSLFGSVYIIGGAAAAYRKDVLTKVGGFDHQTITEDIEMSTRILRHGYRTRYAADAVVFTETPSTWRALCNQRLRWKFGRLQTFHKHRALFLSAGKSRSPYLTFLLLPIALYAEFLLLFESILLTVFVLYTIRTNDYLPLAAVIALITVVICIQVTVDPHRRFHRHLYLLAPVAWIIFYLVDLVEFQALCRSLKRFSLGEGLKWQTWTRSGLGDEQVAPLMQGPGQQPVLIPTDRTAATLTGTALLPMSQAHVSSWNSDVTSQLSREQPKAHDAKEAEFEGTRRAS